MSKVASLNLRIALNVRKNNQIIKFGYLQGNYYFSMQILINSIKNEEN